MENMNNINMSNKNGIAKQYFPLVCKIAAQMSKNSGYDYNSCRSAGNLGLIYAMDNYNESKQEGKKKQTFTQYAAYMIRFYILNDINQNGHIIRVNQDQQKRLKSKGENIELTVSLDRSSDSDDEKNTRTLSNVVVGSSASDIYAAVDPSADEMWKEIFNSLNKVFSQRDLDIFYSTFELNGYEKMAGKDIAVKYNVSPGAVTQVRNKVVSYMKKDKKMREKLLDILQLTTGEGYAM